MKKPIRLPLPTKFAAGTVNAYLFPEPEPVLVDTGEKTERAWTALQSALADRGLHVGDLSQVVITHPHVDHFGLARRIVNQSDAQVLVSELGKPWVINFQGMWHRRMAFYQSAFLRQVGFSPDLIQMVLSYMEMMASICESVPADRVTTFPLDGALPLGSLKWQVVHTPGHASHQTCFYQPDTRQFLSADMLLTKTPTPIVETPPPETSRVPSLPQFLDSLDRVASLEIEVVYPGHGEPFGDHRQLIERQSHRIQRRKSECLALIAGGKSTIVELVNVMYAHLPFEHRFPGLWMLVGYLDLLKADGLIAEETIDGVWHYHVTGKPK